MTKKSPFFTCSLLTNNHADRVICIHTAPREHSTTEIIRFDGQSVNLTFEHTKEGSTRYQRKELNLSSDHVKMIDQDFYKEGSKRNTLVSHCWQLDERGQVARYMRYENDEKEQVLTVNDQQQAKELFQQFIFDGLTIIKQDIKIKELKKHPYSELTVDIGETPRFFVSHKLEQFLQFIHENEAQPLPDIVELYQKTKPQKLVGFSYPSSKKNSPKTK